MWEVQIRNLGGPNYMRGGRVYDDEGKEIPGGGKGYRFVALDPFARGCADSEQVLWKGAGVARRERAV